MSTSAPSGDAWDAERPLATAAERQCLEYTREPVVDPVVQDYAVWRRRQLRLSTLLSVAAVAAVFLMLVDQGIPDDDPYMPKKMVGPYELPPDTRTVIVMGIFALAWVAASVAGLSLLVWSTWRWDRVRASRRAAACAWLASYLGPLPVLLAPIAPLLGYRGMEAAAVSAAHVGTILSIYVPFVYSLFPSSVRAAGAVSQFQRGSSILGVISIAGSMVGSLFLATCTAIVMQVTRDLEAVLGLALLTTSMLIQLVNARSLFHSGPSAPRRRTARRCRWLALGCSLAGVGLLVAYVAHAPAWVAHYVTPGSAIAALFGGLSGRLLTTVVMADALTLALLHEWRSARALAASDEAGPIDARVAAFQYALGPRVVAPATACGAAAS